MVTTTNWIVGGLIVGLGAAALYQGSKMTSLEKEVLALNEKLGSTEANHTKAMEELRSLQNSQAEKIAALGSTKDIAKQVFENHSPELVEAIATSLAQDPAKAARLKGDAGPDPDMDAVVAQLNQSGLVKAVANEIWETRYSELSEMPEVLAAVAEKVYAKYGPELKGADGQSVTATEVAAALALNPDFVAMLKLEQERQ